MAKNSSYKKAVQANLVEKIEETIKKSKTPKATEDPIDILGTAAKSFSLKTETTPIVEEKKAEPEEEVPAVIDSKLVEKDFMEVRKNLKSLIKKGNEAVEKCVGTINEETHARTIETLCDLIKTLVQSNKELINIHEVKKRIVGGDPSTDPQTGEPVKKEESIPMTSSNMNKMVDEAMGVEKRGE